MVLQKLGEDLNSIMILLIPFLRSYCERFGLSYLNSIMILLIRFSLDEVLGCLGIFKFHYDSINSLPAYVSLPAL